MKPTRDPLATVIEEAIGAAWEAGLLFGGQPAEDADSTFPAAAALIAEFVRGWIERETAALSAVESACEVSGTVPKP